MNELHLYNYLMVFENTINILKSSKWNEDFNNRMSCFLLQTRLQASEGDGRTI